jgi:Uma2 family endonuclease
MGTAPILKQMSVDEYLAFEEESPEKNEYYKGEIFAMAGTSFRHNQIVGNTLFAIRSRLKDSCQILPSDLRVSVKAVDLFTYPDLSIVCGKPELLEKKGTTDTLTNPVVLIEVLSRSTENYDRGNKFAFYRLIPSLQEYLLVSSLEQKVELFRKKSAFKWEFTEYANDNEIIELESVGISILLKDLYQNVSFTPEEK